MQFHRITLSSRFLLRLERLKNDSSFSASSSTSRRVICKDRTSFPTSRNVAEAPLQSLYRFHAKLVTVIKSLTPKPNDITMLHGVEMLQEEEEEVEASSMPTDYVIHSLFPLNLTHQGISRGDFRKCQVRCLLDSESSG